MNKTSKFLHIIVDGDYTILFNLKNESFTILNKDLAQYVDDYRQNIDDLSTVHPELFKWMKDNGAIVPEGTDEVARIDRRMEEAGQLSCKFQYDNQSYIELQSSLLVLL